MELRAENDPKAAASADRHDLESARRGDEEAARRVVGKHSASMLRTARRVLARFGERDGEDAVQEALVAALTTAALPIGDVGAWLRAITVRKALDSIRRTKRLQEIAIEEDRPAPAGGFVDAGTVRRALAKLSPQDRSVLVLIDLEGHSCAEAAKLLGSNRIAVKVRAHRARRKLAALLGAVPKKEER